MKDAARLETSFAATLSKSMGIVLQEFYENLSAVGVSAVSGAGMAEFFVAIDVAVKEYHTQYAPLLEIERLSREADAAKKAAESMEKLRIDLRGDGQLIPDLATAGR